ncbi:MAG: hypothetical protein ACP5KG_05450 [Myxococcota bacterium]
MSDINLFNPERNFQIFDNISDGIQVLDKDLRYLYLNKACISQARKNREKFLCQVTAGYCLILMKRYCY